MAELDHGGNVQEIAAQLGADWRTFIDFSASINPLGPPREVLDLMRDCAALLAAYPPNHNAALLAALAEYCGLTPDHLVVGNGATDLIYFVFRFFAPREVLLTCPTFSEFRRACLNLGIGVDAMVLLRTDGRRWCVDWRALDERLRARSPNLLVLVHPNNPTGATLALDEALDVLELTRHRDITVLLDESFIDFIPDESWVSVLAVYEHLVIVRSLTKFFAIPGLRLGYLAASPALTARMRQVREPWQVNQLSQAAGQACVAAREYHERTRRLIADERARLAESLAAIPGFTPFPSRVNFLLVNVDPVVARVSAIHERLLSHRILIRRCDTWSGLPDNCFRVAVRSRAENEQLIEGLRTCV